MNKILSSKTVYLLISESNIGIHSKFEAENFDVIPMNFMPNVIKKDGKYLPRCNLQENKDFKYILHKYNTYRSIEGINVFLIIGFDLDPKGEMMSQALKYQFLQSGIVEDEIHRMALTEQGYIITEDLDIEDYCKFYYIQKKFIDEQTKKNKLSIRNLISIITLEREKNKKLDLSNIDYIDLDGTNTFTSLYYLMNNSKEVE